MADLEAWWALPPAARRAVLEKLMRVAKEEASEHHEDDPSLGVTAVSRNAQQLTVEFVFDAREWVRPLSGSEYWHHHAFHGTALFSVDGDDAVLVKCEHKAWGYPTLVEERNEDTYDWKAMFQGAVTSEPAGVRIRTPRLLLRDFVESDWRAVHEYASDVEVVRNMIWGPNTEAQTREFIQTTLATQKASPRFQYGLAIEFGGRLVGGARLEVQNAAKGEADLGYVVNRSFWRKGIATETARALLKFGFEELKLHRIWATCDPENTGSIRVLEKIGMQREGRLREHQFIKGRWRDSLLYAILNRDWTSLA